MWAQIEDNKIIKMIPRPKSLVINNVQYPSVIFTKAWTNAQRKEIGILPVIYSGTHKNNLFYTHHEGSPEIKEDNVEISFSNTDKDITKIKAEMKKQINIKLSGYLTLTDWIIIRKSDTGKEPPTDLIKWRTDLRAKAVELEELVDAKTAIEELESLLVITAEEANAGKRSAVFYDWPNNPREE